MNTQMFDLVHTKMNMDILSCDSFKVSLYFGDFISLKVKFLVIYNHKMVLWLR